MTLSTIFQLVSHLPPLTVKIYVCFLLRMLWFLPCRETINLNLKSWKRQMEKSWKILVCWERHVVLNLRMSYPSVHFPCVYWDYVGKCIERKLYFDIASWFVTSKSHFTHDCILISDVIYKYLLFAGLTYISLRYPCIDIVVDY